MTLPGTVVFCAQTIRSWVSLSKKDASVGQQRINEVNTGVLVAPAKQPKTVAGGFNQ